MKKTFREHIILMTEGRILCLIFAFGSFVALPWLMIGLPEENWQPILFWATEAFLFTFIILGIWILRNMFWQRSFGKLILTDEAVTFCCFPFPRRSLPLSSCYIGLADYRKHYEGGISKEETYLDPTPVVIYFAEEPLGEEYDGIVEKLRCTKTFIKFRYTDELYFALKEVVPAPRLREITAYYCARDARLAAYESKRKKRKKKKR